LQAELSAKRAGLLLTAILLISGFAFGGASMGAPYRDMIVQIVAVATIAVILILRGDRVARIGILPVALIGAAILILVAQIIPLPAAIWAGLPGRDTVVALSALTGASAVARPLSLDPDATLLSLLALLPGIAAFLAVATLGSRDRLWIARLIIIGAGASLILGAVQFAAGQQATALSLFATSHAGQPIGLFSNSNHQADLMLIGLVFAGCLVPPAHARGAAMRQSPLLFYGLAAAFAIGVIVTGSRLGVLLLPVAIVAVLLRVGLPRKWSGFVLLGVVVGVVAVLLLARNLVIETTFRQFSSLEDSRFSFWPDVLYAIEKFSWFGSGAGTFDNVYRSIEQLVRVSPSYLNHAHNDYLEIVLELGIFGALLIIGFLVFMVLSGIRILNEDGLRAGNALAYAGFCAIVLILVHSIVDYPLRTPLLSIVFGSCCGLLIRRRWIETEIRDGDQSAPVEWAA